ncbi:glycosyltransferase family 15 protein [Moniliophthora roreri MCA 2997]|uniref:Glycosyltransferase family 15 protein n=1 Tax=Moniliophthora roreri (strain MCA 2997) TaxID=1381753 RepID=V2X134_MONRO|nr:glycosyltransferase family 15 protein [Moniliophthora roreri MCA 2997]
MIRWPGRQKHIIAACILVGLLYGTSLLLDDARWLGVALITPRDLLKAQDPLTVGSNDSPQYLPTTEKEQEPSAPRPIGEGTANATLVILARNSDLDGVLSSMGHVEQRFNRHFGYPWVFLNEVEFTEEFKERVTAATSAPVSFGLIPREHWYQPDWVDEDRARMGREKMQAQKIIYAGSVPYRNMCRFNSGFFFQHPLLQPYRYYWRVEPEIEYTCDITYDPFEYMKDHDKIYGFTISFTEWEPTIPTLWETVKEFMDLYPQYVSENNAMRYLSDNGGRSYNLCHFWSNFEIADMDFWRGEVYRKFFEFLDSKGGFYYERWGDAPVHSIAVALFAPLDKLHFFDDIGYRHPPFEHCPKGEARNRRNCSCDPKKSLDYFPQSCIPRYERLF